MHPKSGNILLVIQGAGCIAKSARRVNNSYVQRRATETFHIHICRDYSDTRGANNKASVVLLTLVAGMGIAFA